MVNIPPGGATSPITTTTSLPVNSGAGPTTQPQNLSTPSTTIAGGLAASAPIAPQTNAAPTGADVAKDLAKKAKDAGEKVVDVIVKPTASTAYSVTYKIAPRVLKPGETLYFAVPAALRDRPVSFAILGHRGDPSLDTDTKKDDK